VILGSIAKRALIDPLEGKYDSLWIDIYDVSLFAKECFLWHHLVLVESPAMQVLGLCSKTWPSSVCLCLHSASASSCCGQVLVVIFGQELPEATASLASQVFGLCVALVGLATFAIVLALLQQVMGCMHA
jgi:hypothetical protein